MPREGLPRAKFLGDIKANWNAKRAEDTEASDSKRAVDLAASDEKRAGKAAASATKFAVLTAHITRVAFVLGQQQLKM
jgi:hypothetical protein